MPSLIFFLALFTLGAGLAFGIWQLGETRMAYIRRERSALARRPAGRARF